MNYTKCKSPMGVKPGYYYHRRPYVGVTGFTLPGQIAGIVGARPSVITDIHRCFMAGVLVSEHTLEGKPCDFRNPGRYPAIESVPDIWDDRAFCTAHYCSRSNTVDVDALVERCGLLPGMGVQLNLVWPDPEAFAQLRERKIFTILQVSGKSLEQVDWDGEKLRSRLGPYRADYVLLDLSRGSGTPLDLLKIESLLPHLRFLSGNLAVAGGLGPDPDGLMLERLRPLAKYPSLSALLSVDAESGVRNSLDELDGGKCLAYLGDVMRALEELPFTPASPS